MSGWILFLIGVFVGGVFGFMSAVIFIGSGRAADDEKRLCLEIELAELKKSIKVDP